jgi:hypothetical protein
MLTKLTDLEKKGSSFSFPAIFAKAISRFKQINFNKQSQELVNQAIQTSNTDYQNELSQNDMGDNNNAS